MFTAAQFFNAATTADQVLSWTSVVSHSEHAADVPLTSGRNGHARVFARSVPFVGGGDACCASHPVEVVHATVSPLLLHPPGWQVLFRCVYVNVLITTKHETEASGARGVGGVSLLSNDAGSTVLTPNLTYEKNRTTRRTPAPPNKGPGRFGTKRRFVGESLRAARLIIFE